MQKELRLRHPTDFKRVRQQGKTWKQPALFINVAGNDLSHNRYGFVVSKRLGKAVLRNRLRRQLRACLRQLNLSLKQGYDVVLVTRNPILDLPYQEMCHLVRTMMQQAGLWSATV